MLSATIGQKIKLVRKQKGISQQELAERIGVTWEMISRYERGKSSPMQKIEEIAEALQVELKTFFETSEDNDSALHSMTAQYGVPLLIPVLNELPQDPEDIADSFEKAVMFFSPPYPVFAKGVSANTMFALSLSSGIQVDKSFSFSDCYVICKLVPSESDREYGDIPALYYSNHQYSIKPFKRMYRDSLVAIVTAAVKLF